MIRPATSDDADRLVMLIEEFYEIDGHPFDVPLVEVGLAPLLESDEQGVVLVSDDGELNGYAVLTWGYSLESGGRDALLDELYVRRRGQGVGESLMEAVFAEMRGRGVRRIFLETERENDRARTFYERLGFVVEDSVWLSADIG